jgi:uncharacterized protein YndB with AHSA1/START domain
MDEATAGISIEHGVRIDARPETVFGFFTDPVKMVSWMGIDATLDPQPGGICRIAVNGAGVMVGRYVDVDPPQRVSFTWGWEQRMFDVPPASTSVEVSLTPDGEGTIVRLAHRRLPEGADAPHSRGWRHYLGRLEVAAAGGDPGPDPWLDLGAAWRGLTVDE